MNLLNLDYGFPIVSLYIIIIIFLYLWHYNKIFYKYNLNGPISLPLISIAWYFFHKPNAQIEIDWYKNYGKLYITYRETGELMFSVGDPNYFKQILVKDFHMFYNRLPELKIKHKIIIKNLAYARNENWKRYRSIISPSFTSKKIKKMYSLIVQCHKYCIENLESHVISKTDVNLKDVFNCFSMDVIARTAFGIDINAKKDKNNPFVLNANKIINTPFRRIILLAILPTFLFKLLGFKTFFINEKSSEFFFSVARHLIKIRRENNEKMDDFLQLLIDAQQSDNNEIDKSESHYINQGEDETNAEKQVLNSRFSKKKLDDDEIIAQMFVFFLAGYETTASTLSFCTYELAVNQDIQDKLYNEIKSNADENGDIDYDKLIKLPYLDAVISETLRKYPPVLRLERQANQDYEIPNTKIIVPKNNFVKIPVYSIHHCEEYFPNAEKFDPERFLPENRHLIKPYSYLPFGAGPRNCIGIRFGLLETKFAMFKVLQKFKFVKCSKTDVPVKMMYFRFLSNAAKRLIVGIEKR